MEILKFFGNMTIKAEKFLYETRPISLLFIGLYSIFFPTNLIMQMAGAVLIGCMIVIVRMRLRHRGYIKC